MFTVPVFRKIKRDKSGTRFLREKLPVEAAKHGFKKRGSYDSDSLFAQHSDACVSD
jgi:hypothetical protein